MEDFLLFNGFILTCIFFLSKRDTMPSVGDVFIPVKIKTTYDALVNQSKEVRRINISNLMYTGRDFDGKFVIFKFNELFLKKLNIPYTYMRPYIHHGRSEMLLKIDEKYVLKVLRKLNSDKKLRIVIEDKIV